MRRAARFARTGARTTLLVGLLALLWIVSPRAWSQTFAWEQPFTASNEIYSSPAIGAEGTIYFGTSDGRLYALQSDGSNYWTYSGVGAVVSAPALAFDETVYFGSIDKSLYAVQAVAGSTNGKLRWRFATGGEIRSSPAVGIDGTIYVGSLDNNLYAVRPDGSNRWSFATGAGVFSSPAVGVDGTIYVGSRDKRVYAINSDGREKWHIETGDQVDSSPAIGAGGTIYVGSTDGKLYAINPDNGSTNWVYTANAAILSSPAVGPDGTVYVAAYQGTVYALAPDGTELWKAQVTQSKILYSSIALAADGNLYVGAQNGLLSWTSGGRSNWIVSAIVSGSSPVIGPDGRIYVGSDNHKLYAINGGSPPAPGPWPMFRHDARHTASGFVAAVRQLPSDYSPGATITVSIEITPLPGVVLWAVDETPPPGWNVSQISDSGIFDAGTIRFGPFFDGQPRMLTYLVRSPLTESGVAKFAGTFEINFAPGWIAGDAFLRPIPLHPADQPLVDAWMTVGEVTAYGAAWKRNHPWPTGPSSILPSYLSQAILLWQSGEGYRYDPTAAGSAPFWWVPLPAGVTPPYPAPLPATAGATSPLGNAVCIMPPNVPPGTNLTVVLKVTPASSATVYAVEDQPAPGWAVSNITGGGLYDKQRGKVKWGPFFDTTPRTLSYTVAVPANITGVARFSGAAGFDDTLVGITGVRAPFVGERTSTGTFVVLRHLPPGYSPGRKMTVFLEILPLPDVDYVIVEEVVPAGWLVDRVTDRGVFSIFDRTVRYGVYLDGQGRTLSYDVTPPLFESGAVEFHGVALANETQIVIGGDGALDPSALHPSDANPIDTWITIGELTAYGAAWKRGELWGVPQPPQTIQPDYLIRSIELWFGGEHYGLDLTITNAPFWWVSVTNAVAPGEIPTAIQPGSIAINGTAAVTMPASFQLGVPITVTITSAPNPSVLNYALEDQPPAGWTVLENSISYGGSFDALRGKVKWGPFFENTPRTNSYQVTPPLDAGEVGRFVGGAAFDGQTADFIGSRETVRSGNPPLRFSSVRVLPGGLEITIQGGGAGFCTIQSTTDLIVWGTVGALPTSGGPVVFVDSSATSRIRNFYRVVWH